MKLSRPRWAAEIEAEARMLRRVELSVQTPEVLATGTVEGWPFVVMTHVPGVAIADVWPGLGRADRDRVAAQIGELVRELHALPVDPDPEWGPWIAKLEASAPGRHEGPAHLIEEIPSFLAETPPLPQVLLHTEIYDQHVLVDPDSLDVVSLIDFADGRVGDPRYELPALVELLFREDRTALRHALDATGIDLGPRPAEELLRWSLRHQFGQLSRWLAFVDETPQCMGHLASSVVG
ncbi:MAG: phosphotransferase [Proteobacteria bacterium]|nr:phosphotransferase [Pseudomonadota bacterium]MCP4922061.1 phosphotransferase [Pseudomonadota bacterium]